MTNSSYRALDFQKELIFSEAQIEHTNAMTPLSNEPEIHLRYLMCERSVVAQGLKHLSGCAVKRARLAEFIVDAVFADPHDNEFTVPLI